MTGDLQRVCRGLLELLGTCAQGTAVLQLSTGALLRLHGSLRLDSTGCYNGNLSMTGGSLVNAGVITFAHAQAFDEYPIINATVVNLGSMAFDTTIAGGSGDWTNKGTIRLADGAIGALWGGWLVNNGAINATGSGALSLDGDTFYYGSGTTSGLHPVELNGGRLVDTGSGKGAIWITGRTTFAGNVAANQTVVIVSACPQQEASLIADADWTNKGAVVLAADGACAASATLEQPRGTLTNEGIVRFVAESSSIANGFITGTFDNEKTVDVGAGVILSGDAQFVNGPNALLTLDVASSTRYGALQFGDGSSRNYALGGTLNVSTAPSYWPATGLTFPMIAGSFTGTFATVTGLTRAGHGVGYHVNYTSTGVNLTTS